MLRLSALVALLATSPLAAQHDAHLQGPLRLGAQAIAQVTHASPVLDGEGRTEAALTQPMLSAALSVSPGLALSGMLNLEALTLPDGELNPGIWGEGFVDRRHPHTLLHELTATLQGGVGGVRLSATTGRGFVPFGSDDPMARPFAKYPVNHHLAQVLERLMVGAAARVGPLRLEGALFNGDEPTGTRSLGSPERLGDSWAARGTWQAARGLELGVSHARVASPEQPSGGGLDHQKTHASARWERLLSTADRDYALLEWGRTDELNGDLRSFRFSTALAEVAVRRRGIEAAVRVEQTERPDEERLADPFRTPFPHGDVHVLGITRWRVVTAALSRSAAWGVLRGRPFVEAAYHAAHPLRTPSAFVPREFYGSERLWSLSVGARLEAGAPHSHRPGRYGAAGSFPRVDSE